MTNEARDPHEERHYNGEHRKEDVLKEDLRAFIKRETQQMEDGGEISHNLAARLRTALGHVIYMRPVDDLYRKAHHHSPPSLPADHKIEKVEDLYTVTPTRVLSSAAGQGLLGKAGKEVLDDILEKKGLPPLYRGKDKGNTLKQ